MLEDDEVLALCPEPTNGEKCLVIQLLARLQHVTCVGV